ncbi:MAG TPA: hypothetical protein VLB32_02265 [Candidatus Acidoferrales bacterium]|nr:hypothetical protein [Candidatus Acidoferrales bacterium]
MQATVRCVAWKWGHEEVREFSGDDHLRAKYLTGVLDPDSDNRYSLHLLFYSEENSQGLLYQPDWRRGNRKVLVHFGLAARMELSEKGWIVKEAHGGQYSYLKLTMTANAVWQMREIKVRVPPSAPKDAECSFQQ